MNNVPSPWEAGNRVFLRTAWSASKPSNASCGIWGMRPNNILIKLETSDLISPVFAVLSPSERWNFNIPLYKADALENAT